MSKFKLSDRSKSRLEGVHPHLVSVVELAIQNTAVDFAVLEGIRSVERQRSLVKAGASTTMNSRHLQGFAVDLGAYIGGQIRWDWPLYYKIFDAMNVASIELQIPIEWGGNWRTFRDGPHFQLPHRLYS